MQTPGYVLYTAPQDEIMEDTCANVMTYHGVLVIQVYGHRIRVRVHGLEYNPMWQPSPYGQTQAKDYTSHFHQSHRNITRAFLLRWQMADVQLSAFRRLCNAGPTMGSRISIVHEQR